MDQQDTGVAIAAATQPDGQKPAVPATDYGVGLGVAEMVVRMEQNATEEGSDAWVRLKRAADAIGELRITAEAAEGAWK